MAACTASRAGLDYKLTAGTTCTTLILRPGTGICVHTNGSRAKLSNNSHVTAAINTCRTIDRNHVTGIISLSNVDHLFHACSLCLDLSKRIGC